MINKINLSWQWKKSKRIFMIVCFKQNAIIISVACIWAIRKILNDTQNSYKRIVSMQQLIVSRKRMMRKMTKVRSLWLWNQRFSTAKHMTWIDWTTLKKLLIKQLKKKVNLMKLYKHSLLQQKMLSSKKKIILK